MQEGWGLEKLASGRSAGKDENSRSDDCADAQRGERPRSESFLKPLSWGLGFGDQLVDRLAAEKLIVGGANRFGGFRGWLGQLVVVSWVSIQHSALSIQPVCVPARSLELPGLMLSAFRLQTLPFRLSASELLHFTFLRSASVVAGLLWFFRFVLLASGAL